MKKITYRFATLADIEQLIELRVLMQLEVNDLTSEHADDQYKVRVRSYLQESLENKKYSSSIACDGEKIVGTAGVCFYQKPPSVAGGTGLVGYVTNVYSRLEYRGMGIGTELMKKLNELALEVSADKLHLGATLEGLKIYKNVGYKEPKFVPLEIKF